MGRRTLSFNFFAEPVSSSRRSCVSATSAGSLPSWLPTAAISLLKHSHEKKRLKPKISSTEGVYRGFGMCVSCNYYMKLFS